MKHLSKLIMETSKINSRGTNFVSTMITYQKIMPKNDSQTRPGPE